MNDLTPEQEAFSHLGKTFNELATQVHAAFQPLAIVMQQAVKSWNTVIEDATRDNAYHPTGIVLDTTAQIIDEDIKALPAPREDARMIDWKNLTPDARNQLVAEHIFGWKPEPCPEASIRKNAIWSDHGLQWQCPTCGTGATTLAQIEHGPINPYPRYSEDLSTAWQVVRRLNNSKSPAFPRYEDYWQFIEHLKKIVGSDMFFDLFYCDPEGDHLTPERICIAALRAIGLEVQE